MVHFETTESIVLSPQIGRMIEEVRVEARSIEIIWDDGLALTTTMRRKGSWHICRAGDNQINRKKSAQVVIGLSDLSVICCGASEVETHHDFDPHRHPILGRQGPDLSDADVNLDECVDRMLRYEDADATIAEVLLDQRVLRAVGMTRSQVRTMVRWESVITSLFGAVTGVVLGIVTGVVIVISLNESGISGFTLPITSTIFILIGSFIIGVLAAVFPAWRATRTNIISSIASN